MVNGTLGVWSWTSVAPGSRAKQVIMRSDGLDLAVDLLSTSFAS